MPNIQTRTYFQEVTLMQRIFPTPQRKKGAGPEARPETRGWEMALRNPLSRESASDLHPAS